MDEKQFRKIQEMSYELQRLLEENLPKSHEEAHDGIALACSIRNELEAMGFYVTWIARTTYGDPPITTVEVTLWRPKPNLSPELQKIYDDWFTKRNGLENN